VGATTSLVWECTPVGEARRRQGRDGRGEASRGLRWLSNDRASGRRRHCQVSKWRVAKEGRGSRGEEMRLGF
jgi:hypothetical protein